MRTSNALCLVALTLHAIACAWTQAIADCPGWLQGQSIAGINGPVYSMTLWDPDGDGPEPTLLVVGGQFTLAGNVTANAIAAWDGHAWRAIGDGIKSNSLPPSILALAVYQGVLYAGGSFSTPESVRNLAKFNGTAWVAAAEDPSTSVIALCVHQGELIAGGTFDKFGNTSVKRLAAFDGANWREFAGGTSGTVSALASDGIHLYAGGKFTQAGSALVTNIAAWNGTSWDNMDFGLLTGTNSQTGVASMVLAGSDLIVGGWFDFAGGSPAPNVATWNGVYWEPMAGIATRVYAVTRSAGMTIAATATGLFQWNGWGWTPMNWESAGSVRCFGQYEDKLVAGGIFNLFKPDGYINIAQSDGAIWSGLNAGLTRMPSVLYSLNGKVYAGFSPADPGIALQAWNGSDWFDPYASGPTFWRTVDAIGEHEGELVVSGVLAARSGPPVASTTTIARWRAGDWERIGKGTKAVSGTVAAIASYGGSLFVGGNFTSVDGVTATDFARWNGSTWLAPGGTNGSIAAMTTFNGSLIIAGSFSTIGSISARSIVAWTTQGYQPFGAGFEGQVRTVVAHRGVLYAGGAFTRSGAATVRGIASWDGALWVQVPSATPDVFSLISEPLGLTAVGTFSPIAPTTSRQIARWTGSTWTGFGSGINGSSLTAVKWMDEVVVGGLVSTAGGNPTYGFARWSNTGIPDFTQTPVSLDRPCAGSASFSVAVASGFGDVSFAWRRNGEPISPIDNPTAASGTLLLNPISHADDGIYDCLVTSACANVASPQAALVSTCCPADLNFDSLVDDGDFQIFVVAYDRLVCAGEAAIPGCPSDQNRDSFVDDADFGLFLNAYNALECP